MFRAPVAGIHWVVEGSPRRDRDLRRTRIFVNSTLSRQGPLRRVQVRSIGEWRWRVKHRLGQGLEASLESACWWCEDQEAPPRGWKGPQARIPSILVEQKSDAKQSRS